MFCARFLKNTKIPFPHLNSRSCSVAKNGDNNKQITENPEELFKCVFKFPYIQHVAWLTRLKVYVTGVTFMTSPLVVYGIGQGSIETSYASGLIVLLSFSSLTLLLFGEFMRRVVGMVYTNESKTLVRFAHLSFWGKRHDFVMPTCQIVPIGETGQRSSNYFWMVRFYDSPGERALVISTFLGGVCDKQSFRHIFGQD